MPTVDLTARLARDSKPGPQDTILFDRALPGFGLRIHPSGRKVWIVQARIEGRSRRTVIARHGEMTLAAHTVVGFETNCDKAQFNKHQSLLQNWRADGWRL